MMKNIMVKGKKEKGQIGDTLQNFWRTGKNIH